jgi:hypothetical protein
VRETKEGDVAGQLRVGAGGGPVLPSGGFGDDWERGVHGGVALELGAPALPLALRGDLTYLKLPPVVPSELRYRHFSGTFGLKIDLVPVPLVDAYVIAGGGVYLSDHHFDATAPPPGWKREAGLNAGVGASLNLILVKAFVELRYHRVFGTPARTFAHLTAGLLFP